MLIIRCHAGIAGDSTIVGIVIDMVNVHRSTKVFAHTFYIST